MDEIRLFLEYGTAEEHRAAAIELLERYAGDVLALPVLEKYYRELPEADCDGVRELRLVATSEGILLLAALTFRERIYLYLAQHEEEPTFLGSALQSDISPEFTDFFGLGTTAAEIRAQVEAAPQYRPAALSGALCPVCLCAEDAPHILGCPVEICPWCAGQLTRCGCRFEKMGTEEIADLDDCARFLEILEGAGRICFQRDQRPSYPGDE